MLAYGRLETQSQYRRALTYSQMDANSEQREDKDFASQKRDRSSVAAGAGCEASPDVALGSDHKKARPLR
ncbi:hypothetical protein Pfra02_26420 [Pseudomonas fragi]|nr:hypothetical protein Pfra02_26420 [Pseudomonas fragi]